MTPHPHNADLTVVIPTYGRPAMVRAAVEAARAQTVPVEVVVVDDCSPEPVGEIEGARVVRPARNVGVAAARQLGVEAATTRWVGFCDDDDRLLPRFAEASLAAARPGCAVLSGLANVTEAGEVLHTHLPPSLPAGAHFWMEDVPAGRSFLSKQTLVVERDVLIGVGGFDPEIKGREWTDLLPRLNEAVEIVGVDEVTFHRTVHAGARVSTAGDKRQVNFRLVEDRHRDRLRRHPRGHARFLYDHAYTSWQIGQRRPALAAFARALVRCPSYTLPRAAGQALRIVRLRPAT